MRKLVSYCKHYSTHYDAIKPQEIQTDAKKKSLVKYFPMGVIYFIVPFNFPLFLTFKGGLSALMVGNSIISRNSDSTPLLGNLIEEIVHEAGLNSG